MVFVFIVRPMIHLRLIFSFFSHIYPVLQMPFVENDFFFCIKLLWPLCLKKNTSTGCMSESTSGFTSTELFFYLYVNTTLSALL